jgi:hypothetical protein
MDTSVQSTAEVRLKINDEWQMRVYERYEFKQDGSREFEITVSKAFECVIADLTYNRRDGGDTVFVALRLKAFPTTPFRLSQSYSHPKSYDAPSPIAPQ